MGLRPIRNRAESAISPAKQISPAAKRRISLGKAEFHPNSDLTAPPLNQNLSPEYRDPSPEVMESA